MLHMLFLFFTFDLYFYTSLNEVIGSTKGVEMDDFTELLVNIGRLVVWAVCGFALTILGVSAVIGLIDFASSGVGAFLVLLVLLKIYRDYKDRESK